MFFVLRVMVFNQQILPSLASSQLTMNIHWSCYCTVHVYVVNSCDSVQSFWVKQKCASFFFHCLFMYTCIYICHGESNCQEGEGWNPINLFNPHPTCLCLSQARNWISIDIWSFCVHWFEVRVSRLFCSYWWNCWLSVFTFFS